MNGIDKWETLGIVVVIIIGILLFINIFGEVQTKDRELCELHNQTITTRDCMLLSSCYVYCADENNIIYGYITKE